MENRREVSRKILRKELFRVKKVACVKALR